MNIVGQSKLIQPNHLGAKFTILNLLHSTTGMQSLLNPERRKRRCRQSSDRELWSLLSTAIDKKRANRKRRDPDMFREAVLESVVQKLNEEIMERCMTKKRKHDESYDWRGGSSGHGWNMTSSFQEDEDVLGIDDFFRKLSSCKPE